MHTFGVWAPRAHEVDVVVGEHPHAMARDGDRGWWRVEVEDAGVGTEYAFSVNGGPARPDPRSPWQPLGVDGASRLVDHAAFDWHDARWAGLDVDEALIYELHVGTFSPEGTFDGVARRLDHLVDLGVNAVELMPVNEFSGDRGWGYDGVDLYAPHHAYGGPDGLKRLVDACHERGLAVLLDVVYNHLGPAGNYLREFGPYFTDRYSTPWGEAVNLDGADSDEVRAFFVDNAFTWLRDYHVDGLRIDAVHAIVDTSATHLLEEVAVGVEQLAGQLGRKLFLIAESDLNDPRVVRSREVGGYGIDAQWSDDLHHALHAVLTAERTGYYEDFGSLAQLAKALSQAFVYDGIYSRHRRRRHGRPPEGLSGEKFLAYLQNHDQVGNRANGERSSMLMSTGRLKIAAALVLCSPFVPMLFQGEEWGARTPFLYFTDHRDPELGRAVSEGRRREFASFGWAPEDVPDPQSPETFARSKLDWGELEKPPHDEVLNWHRRLLALRRQTPDLRAGTRGDVVVACDEHERWLLMNRGDVAVVANLSSDACALAGRYPWMRKILLTSDDGATLHEGSLVLPPESVAVVG